MYMYTGHSEQSCDKTAYKVLPRSPWHDVGGNWQLYYPRFGGLDSHVQWKCAREQAVLDKTELTNDFEF